MTFKSVYFYFIFTPLSYLLFTLHLSRRNMGEVADKAFILFLC